MDKNKYIFRVFKKLSLIFGRVPRLRSGRATAHYAFASVLRCTAHCLTACSVSLTQCCIWILCVIGKHTFAFILFDIDYQILTGLNFV
ncbi:MAG: hypothetical protein RML94_00880 [Bacteroidia bacterium]|nr:hypothetical protein [Bacteroidia bacterium]